ncbi:MAG: amino acid ABC transporter substrate-binding protein [Candidatus Tokpelaia sp.]|uniref:amino acid ABC transporter substrate-binding protein n=1 Tax=Candidatus Tokpelaia sp. TaxID=2233777 RepID=UPI001239D7C6|nr:amino acid ABC transporter substrate-binding protein [Candidatus Tokpelaia sp.]KAA6204848.1 MAG: amino acid ABC transporter substrate-binding protein [Candidatus Tokpelaia sp.]KAA6207577.1 MAG: amino acid ABC transporter substrate-binding protein [Candidatus Tokpelaia sp.]KAA6404747.1 amino acid ABC transporter substrate-binding protein [Candidatus Tokpelaia sp.]
MRRFFIIFSVFIAAYGFFTGFVAADTLDNVKKRGYLQCGVSTGLTGFSIPDEKGQWTGFDVDYCRAVAAAVFGDGSKVKFIPLSSKERFTALQSGDIDVLIRNTGWTMGRDIGLGLTAVGVNYYDGQGFMVNSRRLPGITSIAQLSGASICVQSGTSTELTLADYFGRNNLDYTPVVFEKFSEVNAAYDAGRCDVYSTDQSSLYAVRLQLTNPEDNVVLPQLISKEPFALIVRQNDTGWANIIRWTHNALLNAEEYGITENNIDDMLKSTNPDIRRLLGTETGTNLGKILGLDNDWVVKIIKNTGNYGEIFERNIGRSSPLKIARGINDLWIKGGLQYGIPVR